MEACDALGSCWLKPPVVGGIIIGIVGGGAKATGCNWLEAAGDNGPRGWVP
jgi:hypothetical protein